MPHPYDASTEYLLEACLADWLPLIGRTTAARVEIIDADVSTVSAAADHVLRIDEDPSLAGPRRGAVQPRSLAPGPGPRV